MTVAATLVAVGALVILIALLLDRVDWFDLGEIQEERDPEPAQSALPKAWPERRPMASRHYVRTHAQAWAAIDHAHGGNHPNPYPQRTDAFVQWAIAYAEARELLTHQERKPCKQPQQ